MSDVDRYTEEDMKKLETLDGALKGLEGVKIPYNLIVKHFQPLALYLNKVLRGNEDNW